MSDEYEIALTLRVKRDTDGQWVVTQPGQSEFGVDSSPYKAVADFLRCKGEFMEELERVPIGKGLREEYAELVKWAEGEA